MGSWPGKMIFLLNQFHLWAPRTDTSVQLVRWLACAQLMLLFFHVSEFPVVQHLPLSHPTVRHQEMRTQNWQETHSLTIKTLLYFRGIISAQRRTFPVLDFFFLSSHCVLSIDCFTLTCSDCTPHFSLSPYQCEASASPATPVATEPV